jgi:hypothetical protein
MRKITLCVLALVLGLTAGCGKPKLDKHSNFELTGGDGNSFFVDPIKTDQNIKVSGKSSDAIVNVYIYLKKNEMDAKKEINSRKPGNAVLAKQEKTDTIDLEATIPANEEAVIYCSAASNKKTSVDLRITNR